MEENNLKEEWKTLHKELIQKVVDWVKEHNLKDVDLVSFRADCLDASVENGAWHPDTDSCLELYKYSEDPDDSRKPEKPFLTSL